MCHKVGISIYQQSNNNVVSGNDIESSSINGIDIYISNDNKIFNNNIKNNKKIGINAYSAKTNRIYSNNFIDNKDQAYDNNGLNSWDFDKTGNYWSDNKGTGEYVIALGGKNVKDNFPLKSAISMSSDPVATQPAQKGSEGTKSTPEFTVFASIISLITIRIYRMKK